MNSYIFGRMEALQETHEYQFSKIELGQFKLVPYNIPLNLSLNAASIGIQPDRPLFNEAGSITCLDIVDSEFCVCVVCAYLLSIY
jgi:hypothetical protein